MAEEIAFENDWIISNFEGFVTMTLDRVILHTVVHHSSISLPTYQISPKSKKLFEYGGMHIRTDRQTFEASFIRSTVSKSRPKKRKTSQVNKSVHKVGHARKEASHPISIKLHKVEDIPDVIIYTNFGDQLIGLAG